MEEKRRMRGGSWRREVVEQLKFQLRENKEPKNEEVEEETAK